MVFVLIFAFPNVGVNAPLHSLWRERQEALPIA
jgi:hypothetical protein